MTEILQSHSLGEVISFVVALALATKGLVTFWDWSVDRLKRSFNKQTQKEKELQTLEEKIERNEQTIVAISNKQEEHKEALNNLAQSVNLLIQ